jgi:hypothetical protein
VPGRAPHTRRSEGRNRSKRVISARSHDRPGIRYRAGLPQGHRQSNQETLQRISMNYASFYEMSLMGNEGPQPGYFNLESATITEHA